MELLQYSTTHAAVLVGALGCLLLYVLGRTPTNPHKTETEPQKTETEPTIDAAKLRRQQSKSIHDVPEDLDPAVVQELIEARRSIYPKDYTGEPVEDHLVTKLLEAARWAPTHGKTEPWRFVVFGLDKKELLLQATLDWYKQQPQSFWDEAWKGEFADADAFAAYFVKAKQDKWCKASHVVAICLSRQRPREDQKAIPEWEEQAAVACAVQNMHLMSTSMNLAAYWSSYFEHYRTSASCVEFMGLEPGKGDQCMGVFVIGRSNKIDKYRATRTQLEDVVSWR